MMVSASMFLAFLGLGQGQEFIATIDSINTCLSNGSALFGWEISQVPSPLFWKKSDVGNIILILNNNIIKVYPYNATGRAEYLGNATFQLNNLTMSDSGTYICALSSAPTSQTELSVFDLQDCELPVPEVYINGSLVGSYGSLKSYATYELAVFVPPNHPAAVNVSISITDDESIHEQSFVNKSAENCSLSFEAKRQEMTLTVTFSHPATKDATFLHNCTVENLPTCQPLCENGGTCNQATLECICPNGFTGDTCELDDPEPKCKWWCILLIVLAVFIVVVIIIIICCCWHNKVACFGHKSSAQIEVNQKHETNGYGMENKAY